MVTKSTGYDVKDATLTSDDFNPTYVDGGANKAGLRTLGHGALQSMPGDDPGATEGRLVFYATIGYGSI